MVYVLLSPLVQTFPTRSRCPNHTLIVSKLLHQDGPPDGLSHTTKQRGRFQVVTSSVSENFVSVCLADPLNKASHSTQTLHQSRHTTTPTSPPSLFPPSPWRDKKSSVRLFCTGLMNHRPFCSLTVLNYSVALRVYCTFQATFSCRKFSRLQKK